MGWIKRHLPWQFEISNLLATGHGVLVPNEMPLHFVAYFAKNGIYSGAKHGAK
jgi:hypothetical protein